MVIYDAKANPPSAFSLFWGSNIAESNRKVATINIR